MFRPAALCLTAALALSACATPREACINNARSSLATLERLAGETRTNIARGYAVETRQEVRTVRDTCTGRNEDGTSFTFSCEEVETRDRRVPVAIDLNAEQAKLRSLEERIREERAALNPRIQACIANYPE